MINFQKERAFFIEKDGEKARPQSFAAVLSTALLIPCAPADDHSSVEHHGHSGPSWAEEEINRASDAGLLSGYLSGDLRGNVTRAQFCEMALQFTAAAQGYGIENYLSLYNVSSLSGGRLLICCIWYVVSDSRERYLSVLCRYEEWPGEYGNALSVY